MPPLDVAVVSSTGVGMRHHVATGRHQFVTDDHLPDGQSAGPTPYELLLSALGGCAAIAIALYAQRHGWDTGEVNVTVTHEREPERAADGALVLVDIITERITMTGPLTAEQRERLRAIAERCPVARAMKGAARFSTELAE